MLLRIRPWAAEKLRKSLCKRQTFWVGFFFIFLTKIKARDIIKVENLKIPLKLPYFLQKMRENRVSGRICNTPHT